MTTAIIPGGRIRLRMEREKKWRLRYAALYLEVATRYGDELKGARIWRRWRIRRKIRKEVISPMRKEFPRRWALFG